MKAELGRMRMRFEDRSRRHIPVGLRLPAGLVLIVGGLFGFLPVLGFWMIPLGAMLVAMDVRSLHRVWRRDKTAHPDDTSDRDPDEPPQ